MHALFELLFASSVIWPGPNTAGVQGDDIVHVEFIDSRTGDERMKLFQDDPGTWGTCRWLVRQVISIPVQN